MELKEKIEIFINKGWKYDSNTGIFTTHTNIPFKSKTCIIYYNSKTISVQKTHFAWYIMTGEVCFRIKHIDKDQNNFKFNNLMKVEPFNRVEYLKINKPKPKPKIKAKQIILKPEIKKTKKYIIDDELVYEIIISKGKGKLTKNAEIMLIEICNNIIKKFSYKNPDDKNDCKQEAICHVFHEWKNFDECKYSSAFPYFSELAKRAITRCFNQLRWKNNDIIPQFSRLSEYKH